MTDENKVIWEAMENRHTVRKYLDRPLAADVLKKLQDRMDQVNRTFQVSISMETDADSPISFLFGKMMAKNVKNYFILASDESGSADERLGEAGADLMLYAQSLGLNTWWVGGTWNHKLVDEEADNCHVIGVIVFGYGQTPGKPHKSKTAAQVSSYDGTEPKWFQKGIEAALLAPTALNRQSFFIHGQGDQVSIRVKDAPLAQVDEGIVRYFFTLAAGKDHFQWTD